MWGENAKSGIEPDGKRVSRRGAETQSFPEELAVTVVAFSPRDRVFDRLLWRVSARRGVRARGVLR